MAQSLALLPAFAKGPNGSKQIEPDWLEINNPPRKGRFGQCENLADSSANKHLPTPVSHYFATMLSFNKGPIAIKKVLLREKVVNLRGRDTTSSLLVGKPFLEFGVSHYCLFRIIRMKSHHSLFAPAIN
jgi:hypothetical protein